MPTSASSFSRRPADLGADDAAAGGMDWRRLEENPIKARNCGVKVAVFLGFGAIMC
jgi:hypothetical protein